LDFQKLLLLYTVEIERTPTYEFVPFRYGAFSFTSYADLRALISKGLIEAGDERSWRLTPEGRSAVEASHFRPEALGRFLESVADLRGDRLIAETYRRLPYYAIRSELVGRLLVHDPAALAAVEKSRPEPRGAGICTIGYEGRSLEAYMNLLIASGVTLLCDVRRNAISRKYGFSKSTLSHACEGVGIRYEHLPQLGIDSEERRNLKSPKDFEDLFARYERSYLPKQNAALSKISDWVEAGHRVALTCYERDFRQCHRHRVAEGLERRAIGCAATDHL
jgi:hypothetical protein